MTIKNEKEFEEALETAVHVSNDLGLRTELGKGSIIIISDDKELYHKMIQKFTKKKASRFAKKTGKLLGYFGVGISVLSGGVLSWIGVPMVGAGAAMGLTASALNDYKNYKMMIDYDNMRLIFINKNKAGHLYK